MTTPRQLAECGAEFESVDQAMPGPGRRSESEHAQEKNVKESPEREAELEMEYGLELQM